MRCVLLLLALLGLSWASDEECECQWQPPKLGQAGYISPYGFASTKVQANEIRIIRLQERIKELQEMVPMLHGVSRLIKNKRIERRTQELEEYWHASEGCFQDTAAREMRGLKTKDYKVVFKYDNTIHKCAAYCHEKGFAYAGVEYYSECFCSDVLPTFEKRLPARLCHTQCSGNHDQMCGGSWALSIFRASKGVTGCKNDEFRCLDDSGCASTLLVCDKVEDCADGSDESLDLCGQSYVPVGADWQGTIYWDRCSRGRPAQHVLLVVTQSEIKSWFPARLYWDCEITLDGEETYLTTGDWNFSHGRGTFFPVDYEKGQVGFRCESRGAADSSHCKVYMDSEENECGHIKFIWTNYKKGVERQYSVVGESDSLLD